jgi:hypothetical protein
MRYLIIMNLPVSKTAAVTTKMTAMISAIALFENLGVFIDNLSYDFF